MKFQILTILFSMSCLVYGQNTTHVLDRYLEKIEVNHVLPGFSVVVVKDGKINYLKGFGVESIESKKPFTKSTVVPIGSLTKSFTALAILQLAKEGKLELDAPVIKYLTWFRTSNKNMSDKITVRMLINNTSGLYPGTNALSFDLSEKAIESFVKNLKGIFLTREPGLAYEYSNSGFAVAGLIISTVSGQSYSEYLDEHIFKPLGMSRTSTDPDKLLALNSISGHYPSMTSALPAGNESEFKGLEYAPAGSTLSASAEDIGNYLRCLLGGTKPEVVDKKMINQLWSSNIAFPGLTKDDGGDGSSYSYGLGWMISEIEGRRIIHHGGSTGRTSSFTMIDPENGIAASILMNLDLTFIDKYTYPPEFNILNNVMRLAMSSSESHFGIPLVNDPTKNTFDLKPSQLDRYAGTFKQQDGGDVWVYYGVTIGIDKTNAGDLEATLYRGNQIINQFKLDFVNEALAVSRNINVPSYLKFSRSAQGNLSGINFNGITFSKHLVSGQTISLDKGRITFNLPQEWLIKTEGFNFYGEINGVELAGAITDREDTFDIRKLLLQHFKAEVNIVQKDVIKQVNGGVVWQQQVIDFQLNGKQVEVLVLFTETSRSRFWLMIMAPKQDITKNIQQTIRPLLSTFKIGGAG